jgi:hypothetical protein
LSNPLDQKREEALEKVSHLLDEGDEDSRLLTSVHEILKIVTKFMDRVSDQIEHPGFDTSLALRCIG